MARANTVYLIQKAETPGPVRWTTLAAFTVAYEAKAYLKKHFITYGVLNDDVTVVKNFAGIRVQVLPDGDPEFKGKKAKIIELEYEEW